MKKILTLILVIVISVLSCKTKKSKNIEPERPNIILINADDLGYAGIGCYGQELILTPNIDKMAADGMRFTNFYSANTVCVPSRTGMLLGMHPGHCPIRDNSMPHTDNFGERMSSWPSDLWPPELPTIGRIMKDAGYKTAQFGKLEAGIPMDEGKMTEHGWDYWFGFKGTGDAFQYYPTKLWKNDKKLAYPQNESDSIRQPGIVGDKGVYSEELFICEIENYIRENRDTTFFVYFPTQIPHGRSPLDGDEIQLPEIGQYESRDWTHLEKLYAACVSRLDSDIGRIISLLKELGIEKNTIIFFTSDNGDENSYYKYTDRFNGTGPLKGKKRYLYEGGIRVPMIALWPGKIDPGSESDIPSAAWDFMSTLADLAEVSPPEHTDGISLVPILTGDIAELENRDYLYWEYHWGKQQAVRIGKYKGIRIGGTKEPIELYDLSSDPGEIYNIAAEHPDLLKKIDSIMIAARAGSPFNKYWPLPENRLYDSKWDKWIFDNIANNFAK
jgi:arylsulfatase A-like enzyme